MLISVIVPTLNDQAQLPVTLRQRADQPDIELIVADGGSDDLSADIARRLRNVGRLTFIREGLVASAHRWNTHDP